MRGIDNEKRLDILKIDKDDVRYPPLLREINDAPSVLYYRGRLPDPCKPAVAVVGTRHPSPAASRQAIRLGKEFARAGVAVISGLALGIDSLAHRGCLEGGGVTAAVLGSSVDEVFPASNRDLARRILRAGGSLLSEYTPGTPPQKWYYPWRNRIIAGLARATVIVEAPITSGALHTARFASDQGRDVFVASSGVASPIGDGTRALAADGCPIIRSAADVLKDWGIDSTVLREWDEQQRRNGGSVLDEADVLVASLKKELDL